MNKTCNSCVSQQPKWWRKECVKCMESIHNGRCRRWESWFWRGGGGKGGGNREKGLRKFGCTRINVRSLNDGKIEGDFRCSILIVMAWKLLLTRDRVGCVTPDQGLHGVVALPFKIGLWRACNEHYDGGPPLSLISLLFLLFCSLSLSLSLTFFFLLLLLLLRCTASLLAFLYCFCLGVSFCSFSLFWKLLSLFTDFEMSLVFYTWSKNNNKNKTS